MWPNGHAFWPSSPRLISIIGIIGFLRYIPCNCGRRLRPPAVHGERLGVSVADTPPERAGLLASVGFNKVAVKSPVPKKPMGLHL